MTIGPKRWLAAAGALGWICFAAPAAVAQHPGKRLTLTGSDTNVRELFEDLTDDKTLTVMGEAPRSPLGDISGLFQYGIRPNYVLASGNASSGDYEYTPLDVPEPSFYQLASLLGIGSLGMLRKRRAARL